MRVVAGARWSCHGCGFCCRFHQLGPIELTIVRDLEAAEPASWWPPAADGWYRTVMGARGPEYELAKVDGHCVFLTEDQRCAVHARLGAAAKPGFCRLFPYQIVQDARGLAVVVRDSCGGLHASCADGRDVGEGGKQMLPVAQAGGVVLRWAPERVALLPDWDVDLATWMRWEEDLLGWLETASGSPGQLVAGVRQRLSTWGQHPLPVPDPARARLAARASVMALELTLAQVQARETPPSAAEADFVADLLARLRAAGASLEAGADAPLGEDTADYVRLLLSNAILGKDVHRLDGVFAGLGRLLVGVEVAVRSASGPTLGAFAAAHTHIVRFSQNRSIRQVLLRARPALVDLALHASG